MKNVSVLCTSCNETLCLACDQRVHSHPNRSHHLRSPYGISTTHRYWPLLGFGHCTVSKRPSSRLKCVFFFFFFTRLKEEDFISHLSSRPPWECMTCSTLNRGGSVLCITCKRPRGCNNIMSSMLQETSLQKDIWECQACTLQNPSSAVLCAVCDRPRLARKPSRENAESTLSLSKDGTDTRDRYKTMPLPQKTSPLLTEVEMQQSFAFGNKMESVERATQMSKIYGAEDIGAFPKKDGLDNTNTSEKSINDPVHSLRSSLVDVAESSKGSLEQGIKVRKLEVIYGAASTQFMCHDMFRFVV